MGSHNANLPSPLGSSAQPPSFVPPRRTSSRPSPSLTIDSAQNATSAAGQETLGVPNQAQSSRANPNDRSESIGRQSKRSLTRRKRDQSTGSRRAGRRGDSTTEKSTLPADASRTELGQDKSKKRSGFLAFLCCGSGDNTPESGSQDATQPPKPVTKAQPTRAQQPPQSRTQPQDVSATATSEEESKEVIDEKTGVLQSSANGFKSEPKPTSETDRDVEKVAPVSAADLPSNDPPAVTSPATQKAAENPATVPPPIDTSSSLTPIPAVGVQAPTPTVPQSEENPISDRTAEQQALDEEIEQGEKVPMTEDEAHEVDKEIERNHADQSQAAAGTLPPPPPLPKNNNDGSTSAPESQIVTPEPAQKWLLGPIQDRFKGKKCLVLDLDETLVHSSFKVSKHIRDKRSTANDMHRFSIKLTSRSRSKSKANTIMSTSSSVLGSTNS